MKQERDGRVRCSALLDRTAELEMVEAAIRSILTLAGSATTASALSESVSRRNGQRRLHVEMSTQSKRLAVTIETQCLPPAQNGLRHESGTRPRQAGTNQRPEQNLPLPKNPAVAQADKQSKGGQYA